MSELETHVWSHASTIIPLYLCSDTSQFTAVYYLIEHCVINLRHVSDAGAVQFKLVLCCAVHIQHAQSL